MKTQVLTLPFGSPSEIEKVASFLAELSEIGAKFTATFDHGFIVIDFTATT